MDTEGIKSAFTYLHEATEKSAQALEMTYVEAIHETLQNLLLGSAQQINGAPDDQVIKELNNLYQKSQWQALDQEAKHNIIQWLLIEGVKKQEIQANYQATPDAIALIIGYLAFRLVESNRNSLEKSINLFDPCFGTGNLWSLVAKTFTDQDYQVLGAGVDNDDLMLSIGEKAMALLGLSPKLTLADALGDLLVDPCQVIIADLPIGYYPQDQVAQTFKSGAKFIEEGSHAYAHYLLIEQGIHYLEDNAWGLFLVSKSTLTDPTLPQLMQGINETAYLQAFINLPQSLFQNEFSQKSILILQKQGDRAKQSDQVLIGNIPDFKAVDDMKQFTSQFNDWLDKHIVNGE
ncbi:class I SAM-dependent methyltransferase [Aerococcus urinae]|uniref:class I SAM-dependent methyltransferase n=1 Tax=Aerococcus urinae TaxID=1376 RepID=UPI000DCCD3A2|nr:class I SAM-dependent methyltransferase [Aerococcus urinae]